MSRIVIFANGVLSDPQILPRRLRPTDRIFCADGGTHHALRLGLMPHAIIGDLDSLSSEVVSQMESAGVPIYRYPIRKNQTDLELAIQLALAEQPDEILLVTALGGRLDQMLANILLLTRFVQEKARFTLVEGNQAAILLAAYQTITMEGLSGDTVSLIPLTATVTEVTLTNVEWPLEKATLFLGSTLTISNIFTDSQVIVQIGEGLVLVVHISSEALSS